MTNIEIVNSFHSVTGELEQYIIIDNGDGSFTSMTKKHYDTMQEAPQNLGGIN